jgi:hypothetical protein
MEKLLVSTPSHLINAARLEINLDTSGDKFACLYVSDESYLKITPVS